MFWVLFWLRLLDGHLRLVVFGDLSLYTEGFISGFSFMGLKKKYSFCLILFPLCLAVLKCVSINLLLFCSVADLQGSCSCPCDVIVGSC